MFVTGKPSQPSLMFACKASANPSEAPSRLYYSQTLDQDAKAYQGQTLKLFTNICKLQL